MKTLYITQGNNVVVDNDNNSCNKMEATRIGINDAFLVKEPMHVVYGYGEEHKEFDVDVDDIILTFYVSEFKTRIIAIQNEEWSDILKDYEAKKQEEKERWAAAKADTECSDKKCSSC